MGHCVIIGGGAAGLFCAGRALENGHTVTILEHAASLGKKLLITGKGRCNVTNDCDEATLLQNVRTNPRFLYSAVAALPPHDIMRFFEERGVPLKVERGRRVFPQSDKAADILHALTHYARGAEILYVGAKKLWIEDGTVTGVLLQNGEKLAADAVVVATGGVSYPTTGSTGDGYRFARQAGHTVVPAEPSLVALVERGNVAKKMQGLSLRNVNLTLCEDEKPIFSEQGEVLCTHFGLSGPVTLSASAHIRNMKEHSYTVYLDLKPALNEEKLRARIDADFALLAGKDAANSLTKLLPNAMRPVMLQLWGVSPEKRVNQITREERRRLVQLMKAFPVPLQEKGDLQHAIITSGGVNVKEVNPKSMESRLCKNLFFAGEVLDVDAYTGGYNLSIAFATAAAAANHLPA